MAIDTTTETLIAFHEATAHVPGRRVHVSTLHRWRLHGVRGRRLETILCGGRRFTSLEAIQRFKTMRHLRAWSPFPVVTPAVLQPPSANSTGFWIVPDPFRLQSGAISGRRPHQLGARVETVALSDMRQA
jgi:hypothetical protein